MKVYFFEKACLNGHYDLVKLLLESNANINLKDTNGQNALHYAVIGKNDKICKLLCHNKINSSEMTKQAALSSKDYALTTVSDLRISNTKLIKNPMDHPYMIQTKNIKLAEAPNSIYERDEPEFVEDKIFNLISRYQDLILSDLESDVEDIQKGDLKKKQKKKKQGKKKGKGKGKGSAKKKKSKKK